MSDISQAEWECMCDLFDGYRESPTAVLCYGRRIATFRDRGFAERTVERHNTRVRDRRPDGAS